MWGVRYQWRDGREFDAWGYNEHAARGHVATAHGKGWDPQAVALLRRDDPDEAPVTVVTHHPERSADRDVSRKRGVAADDKPARARKKRIPVHPDVAHPTKKNPITGFVSVRVANRP